MTIASLAVLSITTLGAVPTGGAERLQQLTRLPQLSFSIGLTFSGMEGFKLLGHDGDPARALETLRKELAGRPSDAPRYARLGRLLGSANETQLAQRAFAQAAELYEQLGVAESRDPVLLVGYGEVLQEQSKPDQAERCFRRAVEAGPTNWITHAALARFLAGSVIRSFGGPIGVTAVGVMQGEPRFEAGDVEKARRSMAEAMAAVGRAVECGPKAAGAFAARAAVGSTQRMLEAMVATAGNPASDAGLRTLEINRAIFHRDAVPDLWQAARLADPDPEAWGTAAMLDLLAEGFQRGLRQALELLTQDFWPTMPDTTRDRVRQAVTRLEALGQAQEPTQAAQALTQLGTLQYFILRDLVGGEKSLRRATVLDPELPGGWETLTFALVFSRRFDSLAEVCQTRLKHADNLRNRVLLAKAYEKTQQTAAMLVELETAQRKNPESLLGNLALGAGLLKAGDGELARARALQFLAKATQLAGESPPPDVAVEVLFQRGLYFAFSGQRGVARTHFRQILEIDPQDAEATSALQALDQLGE